MSEILVNKLTGTSTAGSILVTGEGNSTTTNLQQGLVKAWFNMNEGSTAAFQDSFNFGSITDNGTGDITVAFTSVFGNANYSLSGSNANSGTNYTRGPGGFYDYTVATSNYRYLSCFGSDASSNGALRDDARMKQMCVGDLA